MSRYQPSIIINIIIGPTSYFPELPLLTYKICQPERTQKIKDIRTWQLKQSAMLLSLWETIGVNIKVVKVPHRSARIAA